MKKKEKIVLFFLTVFMAVVGYGQKDTLQLNREARALLRQGNELYKNEKFSDAEIAYRKALDKNANYDKAKHNYGNALYQGKKFKEAVEQYKITAEHSNNKFAQAQAYHNIGNAMMDQKQYGPAVEAYKNALRRNPNDDETRYNLAVAQKLKKKEEQQGGGGDDNDQNKDNKDQQNKDQQNKDQKNDQNKDNKDKSDQKDKKDGDDKDDQQNKDEGDQDQKDDQKDKGNQGDKDQQKEQPKPKPGKMSQQQIEQLLESLNNEEEKTQKKMNVQKSKGRKVNQEKDW